MERFQTALQSARKLTFHGIPPSSAFEREAGSNEWSGRFWLPDRDSVQPAQKFCLVRADGELGEMRMDRFALCGVSAGPCALWLTKVQNSQDVRTQ